MRYVKKASLKGAHVRRPQVDPGVRASPGAVPFLLQHGPLFTSVCTRSSQQQTKAVPWSQLEQYLG